jgi:cyclophilin family peptidyl-prolyl cis-trans isomerase
MSTRYFFVCIKTTFAACLALLLTACGGGGGGDNPFPPLVTSFRTQTFQYSRPVLILIGGSDLRISMTVESGGACANPSFLDSSTTSSLVLSCTMTQVGEIPLTVKDASGKVLYQTSVTVPKPQVLLKTSAGDVTLELDPVAAPITVNNFLAYVKSGYYESTLFHRVIAGFAVQGGGYTTGLVKKPGQLAQITLESNKGLSNLRGTVAMARTSVPNSAASEFFVNVVTNTFLDYQSAASPGYAVFGTVIQGLDVIDAIAVKPTGTFIGVPDVPLTDVTINAASQVK